MADDVVEQTTPAALAFDLSNCRFKDFRIIRRLGQRTSRPGFYGVNSAVYLAALKEHPEMYYALKICLNLDPMNVESRDLRARFQSEYTVQSGEDRMPRHKNILRVLAVFTDDVAPGSLPDWDFDSVAEHSVVAVMEYVPLTLPQIIAVARAKPGPPYFSDKDALSLASGLLAALTHMSAHRVVHRDLKADNILVTPVGRVVRVADFGCCLDCRHQRLRGFRMPFAVDTLSRGGAAAYFAPEVASAEHGPDAFIDYAKSDVFAAGLILHTMLSADDWPFALRDPRKYTAASYRPLPAVYCEALRRLLDGMLALDPDARYSASEAYAWTCAALAEEQAREAADQNMRDRDSLINRLEELSAAQARLRGDLEDRVRELEARVRQERDDRARDVEQLCKQVNVAWPCDGGVCFVYTVEGVAAKRAASTDEYLPVVSALGYSLQLQIYHNGLFKGTHLSCYLPIARGPNDAALEWPFHHRFSVALLHPSGGAHWVKSRDHAEGSRNTWERPVGRERNIGLGWNEFVSHMEMAAFVTNDQVQIKVTVFQ